MAANRITGPGDQHQQSIQHLADVRARRLGQGTLHLLLQLGQRDDLALHQLEQVDEQQVFLEQLRRARCARRGH